jgi:anti-sigma regulatory factor (Ser/Thr protein kinase)
MTDPWPLRSSLELGALPTAPSCACLHVKHVLREWRLNSLVESAELLVSELVTNAVNATGQPGQTVSVNLAGTGAGVGTGTGTRVLIEVWDAGPQPPGPGEPGEAGPDDGVLLVAALSARWDWYPTQDPAGKVVWCELDTASPAPADLAPPLPRRVPRARPKPQAEIVTDLDLLRRLRDHLRS